MCAGTSRMSLESTECFVCACVSVFCTMCLSALGVGARLMQCLTIPLVPHLQVHYLHQLVSSYLADSARPLHDIYTILHSFSQSLQLEVLHSQVVQLCRDRLGDNVRVHDYQPGRLLSVAYWREVRQPTQ